MIFKFNGVELDASKPIYIVGYEILKGSWFATKPRDEHASKHWKIYPPVVRKGVVESINFEGEKERHVFSIKFYVNGRGFTTITIKDGAFISRSPQTCKREFEKYLRTDYQERIV